MCCQPIFKNGWMNPDKLIFTEKDSSVYPPARLGHYMKEMSELKQLSVIYNSVAPPNFDFVESVKDIYKKSRYHVVSDFTIT
jgi:hypothetical protein